MATPQSPLGGLPNYRTQNRCTFAEVLSSGRMNLNPSNVVDAKMPEDIFSMGMHKGLPAVFCNESVVTNFAKPLKWVLVGKFSQGFNKTNPKLGRPPIEIIDKYLVAMDLKAKVEVGLMDNRHVAIYLGCEEDFLRLYSRSSWIVEGHVMRIFKWHPDFHIDKESTLFPAWISLPKLPLHFFNKTALFGIMSLIGTPLRVDSATASMKRPSLAKVQVEVDLLKEIPEKIWVGTGPSSGFWQKIVVDFLPPYCTHCWHVGHCEEECTVKFPELKSEDKGKGKEIRPKTMKQVYRAKSIYPSEPPATAAVVEQQQKEADNLEAPKQKTADDSTDQKQNSEELAINLEQSKPLGPVEQSSAETNLDIGIIDVDNSECQLPNNLIPNNEEDVVLLNVMNQQSEAPQKVLPAGTQPQQKEELLDQAHMVFQKVKDSVGPSLCVVLPSPFSALASDQDDETDTELNEQVNSVVSTGNLSPRKWPNPATDITTSTRRRSSRRGTLISEPANKNQVSND